MKETPIIFSTPMVQAIQDGRKTMTRRVIVPQPTINADRAILNDFGRWDFINETQRQCAFVCPYGTVGDLLWVRETWRSGIDGTVRSTDYKADGYDYGVDNVYWKPSIFMPKKLARLWLEITEVRAERVQDITYDDFQREGIEKVVWPQLDGSDFVRQPRDVFKDLWDKLNAKRGHGWDKNDWVFPVSFKVIGEK